MQCKCGADTCLSEQVTVEGVEAIETCPQCNRIYKRKNVKKSDVVVCLVGPSGVGKTSVAYALQEEYGYNVIESYTTRPPRYEGEKGHTFVDEKELKKFLPWVDGIVLPGEAIAYNKYDGFEYWATRDQYQGKGVSIYVVDIPGVKMLRETVRDAEIIVITLWADADVRWDRLCGRGDNQTAIIERIAYDNKAFAVIPCDYAINANPDLKTVVERVHKVIRKFILPKNLTN